MKSDTATNIPDIFAQLQELFESGRTAEAFELLSDILRAYESDKARLQIQLEQMRQRMFGRRSEKISSAQLALFNSMVDAIDEKSAEQRRARKHGRPK